MFAGRKSAAVPVAANYIEDVFSTFTYTGTGANRTIDNGISLGYKGLPANTTVSGQLRSYETPENFYTTPNGSAFIGSDSANGWRAGQWIKVDFLTPVTVFTCTYRNGLPQSSGSGWAPSTVELQSSSDDVNWTTRVSYNDLTGSEAINGAIQYIHYTGSETARYWRMYQATDTRGGTTGYNWGFGSFGMYTSSGGNGGLVWIKCRNAARNHNLIDTQRGLKTLYSDFAIAQDDSVTSIRTFNSTSSSSLTPSGITLGTANSVNYTGDTFTSWTFRKQKKFFDMVTFVAATSGKNQRIPHSLGSVPGCIMIKPVSTSGGWYVYHRSLSGAGASAYQNFLSLESTASVSSSANTDRYWGSANPTSTDFGVSDELLYGGGTEASRTYIAYIFAHDAGGFGLSGTDSVISCGKFSAGSNSTSGSATINLGWEPQWILTKNATGTSTRNWQVFDNIRGLTTSFETSYPTSVNMPLNTSGAEGSTGTFSITPTGFKSHGGYNGGDEIIYIAIRKGPMKVPTDATTVFGRDVLNDPASTPLISSDFPVDLAMFFDQSGARDLQFVDRLRGKTVSSKTGATDVETGPIIDSSLDYMNGYGTGASNAPQYGSYLFRRAPGFFDEVCYTGTLANLTLAHNLGVAPELMIVKCRSNNMPGGIAANWAVYAAPQGNNKFALLNTTDIFGTSDVLWQATTPTSTNFYVGAANYVNGSSETYVAWLFASVPGVSKVGTYTGTGTTNQINCGFAAGARFVLVKRADASGDWFLWDTFRGIVSGDDPYFRPNQIAVQVTNTDYIDPYAAGFELSSSAPAAINASGGTFIFLAIA